MLGTIFSTAAKGRKMTTNITKGQPVQRATDRDSSVNTDRNSKSITAAQDRDHTFVCTNGVVFKLW